MFGLTAFKNPIQLQRELKRKPEEYWLKRGEHLALRLFRSMAERVPAYKDFLKKHQIKADIIKNIKDFQKLPLISKDNYLKKYPLEKVCWDGIFTGKHWDISSTSGSTGAPFYFPRDDVKNWQYAITAELYLRNNFEIHRRSTLYINCFALGVWIGGVFTYEAIKLLAKRGKYPLTIINPGLNKTEIIKVVKNLGDKFEQVILGGYPPFIKDVIDDGELEGIDWKKYNLGIVFSAEAFSEKFRNYISQRVGWKNIYTGSLNHYGTVDLGTMAHETPLSILIRRLALRKKTLYRKIFPQEPAQLPTLAQYLPEMFFFEEIDEGVVCSAYGGLPLVRYDLKDRGGVMTLKETRSNLENEKVNLKKEINKAKIKKNVWNLPLVYVYERKDLSISFFGANIYPETVRRALQVKILSKFLTGKFTIMTKKDQRQNPFLEINIELKKNIKSKSLNKNLRKCVSEVILENLLKENSEFHSVFYDQKEGKLMPEIIFWPYESEPYFQAGGKQKWVIKN